MSTRRTTPERPFLPQTESYTSDNKDDSYEKEEKQASISRRPNKGRPALIGLLLLVVVAYFSVSHMQMTSDSKLQQVKSLRWNDESEEDSHDQHESDSEDDQSITTKPESSLHDSQCTIWLGASALKGHPGMGVFTTRDISSGSAVMPKGDGIAIPLFNVHASSKSAPNKEAKSAMLKMWMYYIWSVNKPDHITYEEYGGMSSYFPGYASLTNHHCTLKSLRQRYLEPFYDDSLVNRFEDPGAGAFSYDAGRDNIVNRDVKAGEELFLNYGYCKHGKQHKGTEWADKTFMPQDFKEATNIIFGALWKSLKVKDGELVVDLASDTFESGEISDLVAQLLPKNTEELKEMRLAGDTIDDLQNYLAQYKGLNHREPEWIRELGLCLENFVLGKSTLKQAGNGGIAQFHLSEGEIIAPVPLLQIIDKEALTIYRKLEGEYKAVGKQLLLNYCWGHSESSLLLCPQTNAVLLNHCSTRTKECGSKGPNAQIRWASEWHTSTKAWLKMSLDDMAKEATGGLAFDIVALRDIEAGEEIFIDYGEDWEKAWQSHVDNWQPAEAKTSFNKDSWISAKEANDDKETALKQFTTNDLRRVFEHPYLFTGCHYSVSEQDEKEAYHKEDKEWRKLSDELLIETYADDGESLSKGYAERYQFHKDHSIWPCQILKKESDDTYTVRILQNEYEDEQNWDANRAPRLLTNYSQEGIRFIVNPYKSDQHLEGVFRYPLVIPDEIFPEQWKKT